MRLGEAIEGLPRFVLLEGPTPLQRAPTLSRLLGVDLWLKRDDIGGIGCGGNKLRKLEWLIGEAQAAGATAVVTTGTMQSNHARLTAAAAARAGLKAHLCIRGDAPPERRGNLLLGQMFGATLHFIGERRRDAAHRRMETLAAELEASGEIMAVVPLGGSSALGALGYVLAFEELMAQCLERHVLPDIVAVACGTGSTYAGLLLGARLLQPRTRLAGFSVSRRAARLEGEIERLVTATAGLLGLTPPDRQPAIWLDEGSIGPGYARTSGPGRSALILMARAEGVLLDSTYTAKAFAGLATAIMRGEIARGSTVVFVHTGGTPELFAREPADLEVS